MTASHKKKTPPKPSAVSPEDSQWAAALERARPFMDALPPSELAVVNLDIPTAVAQVLALLPVIGSYRSRLIKLSEINLSHIENLETYASALGYAHGLWIIATSPSGLPAMYAEAVTIRDRFFADASALATRGLVDKKALAGITKGTGYSAVAFELLTLVQLFRQSWDVVQSKSAITVEEMVAAEKLSAELTLASGERAVALNETGDAAETRRRAFTLFTRAYEEVRIGMRYLRARQGDADSLVPSLWSGRGRKRHAASAAADPSAETPSAPDATPVEPVAPGVSTGGESSAGGVGPAHA